MEQRYPLCDLQLARRLERTEARANAAFVEARARLEPGSGATWMDVAGCYAMFDGPGSPLTQTFGLGLFEPIGEHEMEALESFFSDRDAPVFHEVSPLADAGLLPLLTRRGYRAIEFTSVLYRPVAVALPRTGPRESSVQVRRVGAGAAEQWARVAAEGWSSESAELSEFMLELGRISARSEGTYCFLGELEGEAIAAGALSVGEGVALLTGASTVPGARQRGAQSALLEARLRFAAEHGCELAMMGAAPGSASQRNAERQGFRIAYTRIKWEQRRRTA
jgi:hypothetical protein